MDDRYVRWMIRQHFLNQMMPPPDSHKILGSNFLWDLFMCHMWFKAKDSAPTLDFSEDEERRKRISEYAKLRDEQTWKEAKEAQEYAYKRNLNYLIRFLNYQPSNIILKLIILPFQLYIHFTIGTCILLYKFFFNPLSKVLHISQTPNAFTDYIKAQESKIDQH